MDSSDNFQDLKEQALRLKGGIVILSGPSGVGKTSLVEKALEKFPQLEKTITYTTRSPREARETGDHYHFVSLSEFQSLKAKGAFLEWAKFIMSFTPPLLRKSVGSGRREKPL